METKTIQIGFNILRPSIEIQLKEQGFKCNHADCVEFEDARRAIFTLSITDLLTDKQEDQIKKKLFTQIKTHVKKVNKLRQAPIIKS